MFKTRGPLRLGRAGSRNAIACGYCHPAPYGARLAGDSVATSTVNEEISVLNWIIDQSLKHRFLVIVVTLAFAAWGAVSMKYLDVDAFPDTTPVQVQINTVAPALGPEEIEQQITFPIEQVISGLPKLEMVRSVSKFGLSQVVVTFEDGTDIYFARQLINERLSTVELPVGIERSKMGPVATGLGEVFHYVVKGQGTDLTDMRTIHDWVIKPKLRTGQRQVALRAILDQQRRGKNLVRAQELAEEPEDGKRHSASVHRAWAS